MFFSSREIKDELDPIMKSLIKSVISTNFCIFVLDRQGFFLERKLICQEVSGGCIDLESFKSQPAMIILVITSTQPEVENLLCLLTHSYFCTLPVKLAMLMSSMFFI